MLSSLFHPKLSDRLLVVLDLLLAPEDSCSGREDPNRCWKVSLESQVKHHHPEGQLPAWDSTQEITGEWDRGKEPFNSFNACI